MNIRREIPGEKYPYKERDTRREMNIRREIPGERYEYKERDTWREIPG